MKRPLLPLCLLLLAGCASYEVRQDFPKDFAAMRRCFVLSNANDNHALDRQIVAALQARGFTADAGPRTMMPDDTQIVLTYRDTWAWDFGDHLVGMELTAREMKSNFPFATARYNARIPKRRTTEAIVGDLLTQLFGDARR
jgi:hypothetical protein